MLGALVLHVALGYMESMLTNCQTTGFVGYAVRHNPPPYLSSLSGCSMFDVPTATCRPISTRHAPGLRLRHAEQRARHARRPGPHPIQNGDTWLSTELPKILNSAAYQARRMVVFVTSTRRWRWHCEDCAANPADESCHVVTIVVSPRRHTVRRRVGRSPTTPC